MAKREKPAWIVTGAFQSLKDRMTLEETGFGMTVLACMWSKGLKSIRSDPEFILDLVEGQFPPTEQIDADWVRSHWASISNLFRLLPDGSYEPNPLMFSPPSDQPPESSQN